MTHSLTLGSLPLTRSFPDETHGYSFDVLAEGVGFGVAAGVQEVVTSLLADGDLVRTSRYGNREVTFKVEVTGPSLAALAQGEAALRREVGRANLLTWQAPDVISVPTVFEVVTSEMSQDFDDLDELARRRVFAVTLTCAPFARSVDAVTVTALAPAAGVTATISDGSTTTSWTAASPATITSDGADLTVSGTDSTVLAGYSAAVSFASTRFLVVDVTLNGLPLNFRLFVTGSSRVVEPVVVRATSQTRFLYVYDLDGVSATNLQFWVYSPTVSSKSFKIHDVSRTDTIPQVSTRQTARSIEVHGTERTPCSLRVNPAAGEAMGLTIVHTAPESGAGYFPSLRRWRVSGNPETVETGSLSGKKEAVTATPIVAQMPITSLPEDGYALMAYMRSSVAGTFPVTWQARTIVGSTYLGGHEGVANLRFPTANVWTLVPIAVVTLPPVRAASGGLVQFNLTRTVVNEEIYLDEWWPFRVGDDCALTIVNSADASFLWLDSPDVNSPVPRVWVSNDSDRADQRHPGPGLMAQGNHVLTSRTSVFVASTGIQSPSVNVTYHPRWHSNAAE